MASEPVYKVFGIGLNKTGTTTLDECYRLLGLGPVAESGGDEDAHASIRSALAGDYAPALAYAERFRCFQDRPWNIGTMYRALAAAFPDAHRRARTLVGKKAAAEDDLDVLIVTESYSTISKLALA